MDDYALVLNAGSSSLKFSVYQRLEKKDWCLASRGQIEGIGTSPRFSAKDEQGSSNGIWFGGVDFEDPNFKDSEYDKWKAYGQSKTGNALFAVALDRLGYADGVRTFAVHPGGILTNLSRYMLRTT